MSRLPAGLVFDYIADDEVAAAHEIETREFPADEAATFEQFKMRQELAPSLFLGAFLPPSSPNPKRKLIGYVCATRSELQTLTEESMKKHDPLGTSICIHGVVVPSEYQRRGIALELLKEFIARAKVDGLTERILLICHENLRPLYERASFEYTGPSPVVHGAFPWHEMRVVFDRPLKGDKQQDSRDSVPQATMAAASGSSSGSLPPGLLEALQQSSSSRNRPSLRTLSTFEGGMDDVTNSSGDTKTNKHDILCPRPGCGCIILKAGVGSLVQKELPELNKAGQPPPALLAPNPPARSSVPCWLIEPNPMAFENIGFSRAIDTVPDSRSALQRLKLLSCADCDLGPLGWCIEGGREFWLICARVGYRA